MKRSVLVSFGLVILSGCAGGSSGESPAVAFVAGVVCRSDGLSLDTGERARALAPKCEIPVPGASITLELQDGTILSFESEDDGGFEFRAEDIGSVIAIGFDAGGSGGVRLERDPQSDDRLLRPNTNDWFVGLPAAYCKPSRDDNVEAPT